MIFIKQLINGLNLGSIYALIALGYTMVYGIVKLINFAHGDIIMVGAYISLFMITSLSMPIWLALILTVAFCSLLGVAIEGVAYRPLRKSPRISALITAIGVSLFLENLFQLIFSPTPRAFKALFRVPNIVLGDIKISFNTVLTIAVSLAVMLLLSIFVSKTSMGKAMRAVSEDAGAAQLMGININTTISLTFAIGSALAGVGAILYTMSYTQVTPMMGVMPGLKAFVAAVLGGIGSIPGAMIGGLIMGIFEIMTNGYISSQLSDAVVFGILILVLLVKPSGIMGKNITEKV